MTRASVMLRSRRGWVLLAVLLVLAVLSALAAGFFVAASDSSQMSKLAAGRMRANMNADAALADTVRALRARQFDLTSITGTCTDLQVSTDGGCGQMVVTGRVDRGSTLALDEGGGLERDVIIYRRAEPGDIGVPSNRYTVRATGYYGYSVNSPNLITSIVEAEIDVGDPSNFTCQGSYECF